ncbi:MAG: hypothetical protein ACU83P_01940 [Gammaproteobacteria bacterium]
MNPEIEKAKCRRTGALWESRYRATLIDGQTCLLTCMRYIELNPARACMVSFPSDCPGSSYSANALGRADPVAMPHAEYQRRGASDSERRQVYNALFAQGMAEERRNAIREATKSGDRRSAHYKINRLGSSL